ncbi:methyltransferase [Bacillus sp. B15-48]|uniref:methyltransferase n=1 Tax=Bacillus sp. B15-48 TaxID=1548601 RepID=UPI00193EEECE|nr:methyltransferase [Bacillus sp. B15-48]MBM4764506.1 methyltransferase [Bacillus sp. B15-48]
MKEYYYDKLLNIKTGGQPKSSNHPFHYHPYEPTPYSALEQFVQNYEVKSSDYIIDFGCGKGRLNFYLHHFYDATVVGIEMNQSFYHDAVENQQRYMLAKKKAKDKIHFHCCLAEEYEIGPLANRFYFFNPFSIHIFEKIISNILESLEQAPREMELVLYYPSEDYILFLENQGVFHLKKEVILPGLYEKNENERFLIYQLSF